VSLKAEKKSLWLKIDGLVHWRLFCTFKEDQNEQSRHWRGKHPADPAKPSNDTRHPLSPLLQ
jgi:hypothetical protein